MAPQTNILKKTNQKLCSEHLNRETANIGPDRSVGRAPGMYDPNDAGSNPTLVILFCVQPEIKLILSVEGIKFECSRAGLNQNNGQYQTLVRFVWKLYLMKFIFVKKKT